MIDVMPETPHTVRPALDRDEPAIAALVERALNEYRDVDPAMHEGYLRYSLEAGNAPGAERIVVDDGGRIVGAVLFDPRVRHRAHWPRTLATFGTLVVAPTIRRRGIGAVLVRACIDRAKADGATGVAIETMPFMASAEAFYGSFGFVRWEAGDWDGTDVLRGYLDGREAPRTILTGWRLDFD